VVSGSTLLIDLRPGNRPALVGTLDFELLPEIAGRGVRFIKGASSKDVSSNDAGDHAQ
jgi:hypothetical protein